VELKDFVKRALVEIVGAIREAHAEVVDSDGALVAPKLVNPISGITAPIAHEDGAGMANLVEFDLSVTVSEGQEAKHGASGKITIAAIIKAGGSTSEANTEARTAVQRLKFTVPVRYPNGKPKPRETSATSSSWKSA
jgi:hypothetical protein